MKLKRNSVCQIQQSDWSLRTKHGALGAENDSQPHVPRNLTGLEDLTAAKISRSRVSRTRCLMSAGSAASGSDHLERILDRSGKNAATNWKSAVRRFCEYLRTQPPPDCHVK